jgi:integrase
VSLYKQKGSKYWWYSFVFNGRHIQASSKVTNKKEAQTIEAARRTQLAKELVGIVEKPKAKPRSVSDLLDALKADYELRGKGTVTNLSLFRVVKGEFGKSMADRLTDEDVTGYIERKRKEKLADSTIANRLQILVQAFKHAKLTAPLIPTLSCDNVRSGFLTPAEFEVLRGYLTDDLQDFALFGYLTGWRKGAIQKLEWSDVREGKVYLRAKHSKNGRPYFVPINDDLKKLLGRREAARTVEGEGSSVSLCSLVFHRHGLPVKDFDKSWRTACTKAGCQGLLFHDLRRSAARNLRRSGVAESVAMRITGHETNSMFRRYSIVDEQDLTEAMEKVSNYNQAERAKVVAIAK